MANAIMLNGSGTGETDYLKYATNIQYLFNGLTQQDCPNEIILNLPNCTGLTYGPSNLCCPDKYEINLNDDGRCTSMVGACRWGNNVVKPVQIKITGNLSNVTSYQNCFQNMGLGTVEGNPIDIDADFDFTSATNVSGFLYNCYRIRSIRFVPNTLKIDFDLNAALYSYSGNESSYVSIANGLNEDVTGKTLSIHDDGKFRLPLIKGNVQMDESNTYHLFVLNEQGDTNLQEFITNTKGWSIA